MIRFFDILFSSIALVVLSPLFVVVMIILRFTSEREVFFRQNRVGKDGTKFKVIKFATMLKDSPNICTGTVTVKNDPRVLPFGKILRRAKINELPQLINIIKGDMSIVGPRPQTERCFNAFPKDVQEQIVKVRPGLTSIGSIVFRDEENILHNDNEQVKFYDEVIAPYKGKLEKWYIKHLSMKIYFLIIFATILVVLFPSSQIVWRIFEGLPFAPESLKLKV